MGITRLSLHRASPWQDAYAERLIGSIRRKYLDHVIVFNEHHLRSVLWSVFHTITTPERIFRLARTARGLATHNFPRPTTSLPSQELVVCTIAMSVKPLSLGDLFSS